LPARNHNTSKCKPIFTYNIDVVLSPEITMCSAILDTVEPKPTHSVPVDIGFEETKEGDVFIHCNWA
jgi:hypothetical protein